METTDVHVYIGKYENSSWNWTDINNYSLGTGRKLAYRKCTGLEDVGKVKNVYTETYADSDVVRTDFPTTKCYEATTITLDLVVIRSASVNSGDNDLKDIVDLVSFTTPTVFWDNVRKKMAVMTLMNAAEAKEDNYKGMKYLEVELKFNNLIGYCPYVNDTYTNSHLPYVEAAALPIITKVLS